MIRTGQQYREALLEEREVFVGGERITDVTKYPPFRRPIESFAAQYDAKHSSAHHDLLTWTDPIAGTFDISFLIPKSHDELRAKGIAFAEFAKLSYGCLSRGPESMAALMAGLEESCEWFEQWGEGNHQKVLDYCHFVRDNDLFVTHALGNPQTDRSKPSHQQENPYLHLRIKEELEDGIVIRGAKQLATGAPFADEVIVFPNGRTFGPGDEEYCLCFSVPTTANGLKIMCREPLVMDDSLKIYDHPLSSRYEEIDALLVFDDVFVPWERVFFHNNLFAANNMRFMTSVASFSGHLSVRRAAIRSSLTVATAMEMCKSVKTADFPNVGELLGKIAALQKSLEALVFQAEEDPRVAENGTYFVNPDALTASGLLYPDFYTTMLETIKRTGAAGLMLTPTQADFTGEAGEFAETYFAGADGMPGSDRVQIAKLAWDLVGGPIAQRMNHYERFYIGEPMFVSTFFSKAVELNEGRELFERVIEEGRTL